MRTSARNEIDHQATCGSLPQFLAERKRNRCQLGEGYGAALKRWPVTLRPSPALVPARSTFRGSIEHGRRGCRATSTWRRVARARRRAASLHAWAAGVERRSLHARPAPQHWTASGGGRISRVGFVKVSPQSGLPARRSYLAFICFDHNSEHMRNLLEMRRPQLGIIRAAGEPALVLLRSTHVVIFLFFFDEVCHSGST